MIKKYHFTISNLLLITACIYFSVNGFYKIVTAKIEDTHMPKEITYRVSAPHTDFSHPFSYYQVIAERNLFDTKGKQAQQPEDKAETPEELEETTLNLTLWGTVAGDEGKSGYAVIEDKKDRKFIKFHAVQSIVLNVALWIVIILLSLPTAGCISLLWLITLWPAYDSYQGKYTEIPFISNFVKNQNWI